MLISVIVPVYNTPPDKLSRCLNSILSDDTTEVEVVLIDDGSQQAMSAQYQEMCGTYRNIQYYRKENGGPALARNYGVEKARGTYAAFVDADDYVSKQCFRQAQAVIAQYQPDLVIGLTKRCCGDDDNVLISAQTGQPNIQMLTDETTRIRLLEHMLGRIDLSFLSLGFPIGYIGDGPCARVFRREIFLKAPFNSEPYWSEDTIWNISLIKECKTIAICNEIWYAYALYEKSLTQRYRKNCMNEFLFRTRQEFETMKQLWPQKMDGIYHQIWREIYMLCRTFIFHPENPMRVREKYGLLKDAIQSEAYQRALAGVRFDYPQNRLKRFGKEFLRLSMRKGWYPLCYLILKYTC